MRNLRRFDPKDAGIDGDQFRMAAPAVGRTGTEHRVAFLQILHVLADTDHDTRQIASRDIGKVEFEPGPHMAGPYLPVDRVDAGGMHFHQYVVRPRYRVRHFGQPHARQVAIVVVD